MCDPSSAPPLRSFEGDRADLPVAEAERVGAHREVSGPPDGVLDAHVGHEVVVIDRVRPAVLVLVLGVHDDATALVDRKSKAMFVLSSSLLGGPFLPPR